MNRSFDLILNHHRRLLNHPTNNCRDTFILKPTHLKPKRSPLSSQSIITSKIYSWPQKITNYIQLPTQDHLKDAPRLSPGLRSVAAQASSASWWPTSMAASPTSAAKAAEERCPSTFSARRWRRKSKISTTWTPRRQRTDGMFHGMKIKVWDVL